MSMVVERKVIIKDILQKSPCENCNICVRLRLLEMGLVPGQKIRIKKFRDDLWTITLLDENEMSISTLGLRKEEAERMLLEEDCVVSLV